MMAIWVERQLAQTPPSQASTASSLRGLPDGQDVIAYLNQTIDWHRQLATEEQVVTDPGDVLYLNDDHQAATQILRLSFDFARADAQFIASQGAGGADSQAQSAPPGRFQALYRQAQAADQELKQTQAELQSTKDQLQTARGADRQKLQAQMDELQSEINLAQTRSKALHDLLQFTGSASGSEGNLVSQIDQLQRSVPELESGPEKNTDSRSSTGAVNASSLRRNQPSGILGLSEELFSLSGKLHTLEQREKTTDALSQGSQRLRAPLISALTAAAQQGEDAAKQADTSDSAQLEQLKSRLDSLAANFKQYSSVMLPLSKQSVVLDFYKATLSRWHGAVQSEISAIMRRLMLRIAIFGGILVLVLALSEAWGRAVLRYVHDARRRYQFLLLRRIIVWCVAGITIAFALATEVGSIATFAGLITAGIAVALQNLIMAVAGYFFLIGKYGVRVGDRVQISNVTGDVIDIGLIRLHLIEVGGSEADRQPTGRVVVFSNAVVFQPTASFFKQIPGTSFVWHEVSLTLAPESEYTLAEKRMIGAVEKVFADYRESIERQHREMERTLSVAVAVPKPRSRLRLTQTGLEVVIRYPAELENAAEVDDRITRELLRALDEKPKLKVVGTGVPNIQPVTDETRAA
ncbi:MAG TPA: mechanosensitive ion channel domain-containing protein [Candidatus Angelobacter sp.]|nr:mechanosensitive ion channel domain-containing protein [Candidatus Angelobacter sp.]